ncbi:hypothetical protein LINGRAHAP2_LOCUS30000, partial [Linum grandiflorum]
FDTEKEAIAVAKEIAKEHRFFLVNGSGKRNTKEVHRRVYLYCEHGYERKPRKNTDSKKSRQVSKTGKIGCPFQVQVWALRVGASEWKWVLEHGSGFHNHKPERYPEGRRQRNEFTEAEMVDIREMEALCSTPKHIKKLLNDKYKVHHNMRQIYNYCMKLRKERLKGMSPSRWTLKAAQDLHYFVQCSTDDENHISNIFLSHPECIRMLGAWYFVILIDSTYKTDIYNKPLVQLIGVTPVQNNLSLGLHWWRMRKRRLMFEF